MSTRRLDSIADYRRLGLRLRVECHCGRVRVIEPGDLMVALGRRKSSSRQMALLMPRLRCFECGGPAEVLGPCVSSTSRADCDPAPANVRNGWKADMNDGKSDRCAR